MDCTRDHVFSPDVESVTKIDPPISKELYMPKTYGELHVLGSSKTSHKRCFILEQPSEKNSSKIARTSDVHMSSNHETVLEKYSLDENYDVFQIGRQAPNIDFVVNCGDMFSRSSVSTYACRIIAEKANPLNIRVYAGACDADGTIQLNRNSMKWKDGDHLDGLTKNGVLLLHLSDNGTYEGSVWREVSLRGKMFSLRQTRSSSEKAREDKSATNMLKDWSLIDLCGVTLLFRTPEGLKERPTEDDLRKFLCNSEIYENIVIPRKIASDKSSAAVCFKCGNLQKGNFLSMECQSCHERGCIQRVCMGMQREFLKDAGSKLCTEKLCAINPCGHLTSEKTAKFWGQLSLPHGTSSFISCCPFCLCPLEGYTGYILTR